MDASESSSSLGQIPFDLPGVSGPWVRSILATLLLWEKPLGLHGSDALQFSEHLLSSSADPTFGALVGDGLGVSTAGCNSPKRSFDDVKALAHQTCPKKMSVDLVAHGVHLTHRFRFVSAREVLAVSVRAWTSCEASEWGPSTRGLWCSSGFFCCTQLCLSV